MAWKLELCRWDAGLSYLGEVVGARNRKLTDGLYKLATFAFDLGFDSPMAEYLLDEDDPAIVIASKQSPYDLSWQVQFAGPVASAEEQAGEGVASMSVAAVGAGVRLGKVIGNLDNATQDGKAEAGIKFTTIDKADLSRLLVVRANERVNTWLRTVGTEASGRAVDSTDGIGGFKTVAGIIEELAQSGDLEWRVEPERSSDGTGPVLGRIRLGAQVGSDRSGMGGVALDYGTGTYSLKSIKRRTEQQMANSVWHARSGVTPYSVHADVPAAIARHGLLEEIADAELTDPGLRSDWVAAVAAVRRRPRQMIEAVALPSTEPSVPVYGWGLDYQVGDRVLVRGEWGGEALARSLNAAVRVWDVSVEIDDAGTETVTLGLAKA